MPLATHGSIKTYYETFGDPGHPTLLLVNGLGSQSIMYRDAWCERFAAAGYHVVRFDNRDTGLSTHHAEVLDLGELMAALAAGDPVLAPYTVSDMADDAVAVLDDLGVDRAHVMGLSMGGMIVQRMAINHPQRLLSMTSVMSTTGENEFGQATGEAQAMLLRPASTTREDYVSSSLVGLGVWGSPGLVDEAAMGELYGQAWDRDHDEGATTRQIGAVMTDGSRVAGLRAITTPTLVMHGSADTLIDPSGGRRTAELIPGAQFELIEGMGHDYPEPLWATWIERWTRFVAAL